MEIDSQSSWQCTVQISKPPIIFTVSVPKHLVVSVGGDMRLRSHDVQMLTITVAKEVMHRSEVEGSFR